MKQILCIKSSNDRSPGALEAPVIKGEQYTPTNKLNFNGFSYYQLKERPLGDCYKSDLFVDLPNEEGVIFSKKIEELQLI